MLASDHKFAKLELAKFYSELKFSHELSCEKAQQPWRLALDTLFEELPDPNGGALSKTMLPSAIMTNNEVSKIRYSSYT